MEKPTIDNTHAVLQAGDTVSTYLIQAISFIDKQLGDGYAHDHPQLLAECIRSQTLDFNNLALVAALYEIAENLPSSL